MAKQIGIIILTDSVEDVRGMLNQLENTFDCITSTAVVKTNTPAGTVTPAVVGAPGVLDTPATPVVSTVCDINGMPWDARIHSGATEADGSYKKKNNGVWQKRRGVTEMQIKTVEAEIMATYAGGAALPSSTADLAPSAPAGVGIPGKPSAVVTPPPLVLPVPADVSTANVQDCVNITQVFAQMHGNDAMQKILDEWNMTTIDMLPTHLYPDYINYLVEADADAS